jgi:SSS family solute:Na+ symporter
MPIGLVGLIIAAIFAAAMSSIAAELNSLSTSTVIDFYRRHFRPHASDSHYLAVSKFATGLWGMVACGFAIVAANQGSLIEVVNRIGSLFYGSLLGVFVLAIGSRRATGRGAFWGVVAGMIAVLWFAFASDISFLWHNVIGAVVVIVVGLLVSVTDRTPAPPGGLAEAAPSSP